MVSSLRQLDNLTIKHEKDYREITSLDKLSDSNLFKPAFMNNFWLCLLLSKIIMIINVALNLSSM